MKSTKCQPARLAFSGLAADVVHHLRHRKRKKPRTKNTCFRTSFRSMHTSDMTTCPRQPDRRRNYTNCCGFCTIVAGGVAVRGGVSVTASSSPGNPWKRCFRNICRLLAFGNEKKRELRKRRETREFHQHSPSATTNTKIVREADDGSHSRRMEVFKNKFPTRLCFTISYYYFFYGRDCHLVLALPRHVRSGEHHPGVLLPEGVGVHLVVDPRLKRFGQLEHEVRSRGDAVRVKPTTQKKGGKNASNLSRTCRNVYSVGINQKGGQLKKKAEKRRQT